MEVEAETFHVICIMNMSIEYSTMQYREWEQILLKKAQHVFMLYNLTIDNFDAQSGISPTAHMTKDDKQDVYHIATIVMKNMLLDVVTSRSHSNFPKMFSNPLNRLDW